MHRELLAPLVCIALAHGAAGQDPLRPSRVDPQIAAALARISPERIQAIVEKLAGFPTRSTLSAQDPDSIAAGRGIGAAREWIKAEFERCARDCDGRIEVKTDEFTEAATKRIPDPTPITNVYAILKGKDEESAQRCVLVTGHYDSRNADVLDRTGLAPGANDDASGIAVSLECARVLGKLELPATIVFLAVAGEEQGLNGSKHFAQMAKSAGWNVEAALNDDIVGGDKSPGQDSTVVRVFSEGLPVAATDDELKTLRGIGAESDSPSRQLARYVAETARTYETGLKPLLVFRTDRYSRGGDHTSFNQQGFAAVRFTEYLENFHHQHQSAHAENGIEYGDLPKFVDFEYVARVARLNAATLASLASAPAAPAKVRFVNKGLQNDSTLSWEASARAASYEVLWRATTSPDWEHAQLVEKETRATLAPSKDNVIFAVRAVDKDGHKSLPVIPLPGK